MATGIVALLLSAGVLVSAIANGLYLSTPVYDAIQVGDREQAVSQRIPRQLIAPSRDVGIAPAEGASCVVYLLDVAYAGADHDLDTRYRLCFRNGMLVEKREILP
ncbi:hypothetical protein DMH04_13830 [Kibdelosporangium aridum]|uniref:Uncharacterized protein n=1 Tax=Kibdelosporangium aridum TaxID=2030 RepID=A0A428ZDY3_KIBAR|nr:hypothetical protein [Kibdelosporangium aridum]RSM86251.1 hypothetical protein DMH04_13830 [Kibdelosporangium aridum]